VGGHAGSTIRVRDALEERLARLRWPVEVTDWLGERYTVGGAETHWTGRVLSVHLKTPAAGRDLLRVDGLRFVERFLAGEVDLEGNLYAIPAISRELGAWLKPWHLLRGLGPVLAFQSPARARVSVRSHYDIDQRALETYLDRAYLAYSCAMFEEPERLVVDELVRPGRGREDAFDSLEKAQWRKFQDAVDFLSPRPGETLLDVGCGYGGQLAVALESHPFGRVVGWTHSSNQVAEGRRRLAGFGRWELNEGDYRSELRVFDHVTSTGMVSHVGPRGLEPYVRNVRRRIRRGGRYVHHALMTPHQRLPLDLQVGPFFHKKYVWPGFHWFTLGEHVRALERNGFHVERAVGLRRHYAKTTAAWYERMMARREEMRGWLGEAGLRAWQLYLAGSSGSFLEKDIHVYRLYCEAV
jgi:cyclopropane-fatty-acyl-phospholipid synthase